MSTFPIAAKVTGDVSGFVTAMGAGSASMRAFAGSAGLATGALGAFAGAAAMGLAIGAAREYQAELVKLNTLVGIQADQVEAWGEEMRLIATRTGQAPAELARAMFAITSGGARGQQALDLLEQSAQAAAIGLGDMVSIGRTATAVMQAFGDTGLTAEKAIDVMVATVREGNLEAESLAGSLSRVLGPARSLGVEFEEIGGFMATFTRLGGSTEQAATGLLNTFNLLIKPPQQARDAIEELITGGMQELRRVVSEEGLIEGLNLMKEAFEGNLDVLGEMVPNSRSLIAILNTVGLQGEAYAQVQENINESLGTTAESFIVWADSADAAFKNFQAQLAVTGVEIGENLLPPLTALLKALGALSEVLRFSIEGWQNLFKVIGESPEFEALGRIFNWVADQGAEATSRLGPEWEGIKQLFAALGGEVEEVGDDFEILDRILAGMSLDRLRERSSELASDLVETKDRISEIRDELAELQQPIALADLPDDGRYKPAVRAELLEERRAQTVALNEELATLVEREESLGEVLLRTNDAMRDRAFAEQEVAAAVEETAAAEEESAEDRAARLQAINDLVGGLERERLEMELSRREILLHDLAQLGATETTIERALAELDLIEAIEARRREEAAAKRQEQRIARERQRARERSLREKEQARERERRAAERAFEREELVRLQREMELLGDVSDAFADSMVEAFGAIIEGTESVSEAFGNMVDAIIAELARLAVREAVSEIIGLAGEAIGAIGGDVDEVVGSATTTDAVIESLGGVQNQASAGLETSGFRSIGEQIGKNIPLSSMIESATLTPAGQMVGATTGPATIVQQTIHFTPQFIDAADGARWLRTQQGEIAGIVGRAAQQSAEFSAALRGRV